MLMTTFGRGDIGHPLAQLVDVGALLADHDAGARRMDRHPALSCADASITILATAACLSSLCRISRILTILVQQLAVFVLAGEPTGIPRPVDAETQPDWIDLFDPSFSPALLSASLSLDLTNDDRQLREWFKNPARAATAAPARNVSSRAVADMSSETIQIVDIEIVIVLGIGDGRFQALLDVDRNPLARELQIGKGSRSLPAADQLRDKIKLLRADPQHAGDRLGLVIREAPFRALVCSSLSPQA